ncbi:MAG: methylenetetrahydrofolate reductase [Vampirovibrionales bacterium]|nr:methylenetetrahydrofolate reductase [Vampirovibrionales bacterium]
MTDSFQDKLSQGRFVITAELSPPRGSQPQLMLSRAQALASLAVGLDAINVPDCQRAMLKMSSMAASVLIQQTCGIEAIWQLTCRDRNLIALQADILGGYGLGLKNILALTGDPVQVGDQAPMAHQVFHLEAVRMLDLLQKLNAGNDALQAPLKAQGTQFCVGSALNLNKLHSGAQQQRLRQKLARGVVFFQTQPIYALEVLEQGLTVLAQCAQAEGVPCPKVLMGVVPPKSAEAAARLNQVSGIQIPAEWGASLEAARDPLEASLAQYSNLMQRCLPLVQGFHVMPVGIEASVIRYWQAHPDWVPRPGA